MTDRMRASISGGQLLQSRLIGNFLAHHPGYTPITRHLYMCFSHIARYPTRFTGAPAHLGSGGRGNGTLRLRKERIYFLFIFLFVPYSFFAGHAT
jgi:hypothetical protein